MFLNVIGIKLDDEYQNKIYESFDGEVNFESSVDAALEKIKKNKFDVVVIQGDFFDEDELVDSAQKIIKLQKKIIVIIVSEKSSLRTVARTIKAGVYDYLLKPVDADFLIKTIESAVKSGKLRAEKVEKNKNIGSRLIGNSMEMLEVYKLVGKFAGSRLPVIIKGEKGTGKSSVASAIHRFGDFSDKPFISINCTAFKDEVLERKLFGYEKGAFSEALYSKVGAFEEVDGGTLHLGNVESLSLDMQSKLLDFLHEGVSIKIGGSKIIKPDIRLIVTTSENIEVLISSGKFIEEFYHRLRLLEMEIPSLRERKADIPLIIDYNIKKYNDELGKNVRGVSKPAMKKIMRYEWPGNIRELKNAIISAIALCRGGLILIEDLPGDVAGAKSVKRKPDLQDWILADWIEKERVLLSSVGKKDYHRDIVSKVERELMRQVLEISTGKRVEAADILGITRNTLRYKMNNFKLD